MNKDITMTRRNALLAIPAAGAAVLAFPSVVEATSSPSVSDLIDAHRAAHEAFCDLCDLEDAASTAAKLPFRLVPVFMKENGKPLRYYEFSADPEGTEDAIHQVHDEMRKLHCGKAAAAILPAKVVEASSWAITVSLRRCLREYRKALAWAEQHRKDSGYADIQSRHSAADDAEREALRVLCAAHCSTEAEAKAKGEYLTHFLAHNQLTDEHVDALLASLTAVPRAA